MEIGVTPYCVHYYCEPIVPPHGEDIFIQHSFNKAGKGKPKYLDKNQSQYQFSHNKFYIDCPRIEQQPLR
jgi:hypothetical protein